MGLDNIGAIDSSNAGGGAANLGAADLSAGTERSIDSLSSSISDGIGAGDQGKFSSPGAQKDFQNQLHSAVGDIVKGSEAARAEGKSPSSNAQFKQGIQELMSALQGMLGQKGAEGQGQAGEHGKDGASGAGGAGGAEPSQGDSQSGGDDMIKKLIAMLRKMGMSDKDIAALLGKMMPPAQANQLLASTPKDGGSDSSSSGIDGSSGVGGGGFQNMN